MEKINGAKVDNEKNKNLKKKKQRIINKLLSYEHPELELYFIFTNWTENIWNFSVAIWKYKLEYEYIFNTKRKCKNKKKYWV